MTSSHESLKVPIFNTGTFQASNLAANVASTRRVNDVNQSTNSTISTTTITIRGKVFDIDVLTKLQQKQALGSFVSFTKSEQSTGSANALSNQDQHVPSMYKPHAKKIHAKSTPKETYQNEKTLLPKTVLSSNNKNSLTPVTTKSDFTPQVNNDHGGYYSITSLTNGTTEVVKQNINSSISEKKSSFLHNSFLLQGKSKILNSSKNNYQQQIQLQQQKEHKSPQQNIQELSSCIQSVKFVSNVLFQNKMSPKTNKKKSPASTYSTESLEDGCNFLKGSSSKKFIKNQKYQPKNQKKSSDIKLGKIMGFDELYRKAVNNVLKIKTFSDEGNKNQIHSLDEFKEEFKHYMETPINFDQKINNISMEQKETENNLNDNFKLRRLKSDIASLKRAKLFPFTTKDTNSKWENHNDDMSRKKQFFSDFLSDKVRYPPRQYYSPIDFPWFYHPYYHPSYFVPMKSNEHLQSPFQFKNGKIKVTNSQHEAPSKTIAENNTKLGSNVLTTDVEVTQRKDLNGNVKRQKKSSDKNKKLKETNTRNHMLSTSNKIQISEKTKRKIHNTKFRYSLRQRFKSLEKSMKQHGNKSTQPKFILKKFDRKRSTKKELFLGSLGLMRIIKRI